MASTTEAAVPTGATPEVALSVDEAWSHAIKLRAAIDKELEYVQKESPGTRETARFEKVETLLQNYRLACIATIWPDIRAATDKKAEEALWGTHNSITKSYRKALSKIQGPNHIVARRKMDRLFTHYLKTAQYFYRGYLQRICARYQMTDLQRIARRADLEEMPVPDEDKVDAEAKKLDEVVRTSCHKTLIYLGDLARYRTTRGKEPKWDNALAYYLLADELMPDLGHGHHQCSVIYCETGDHFEVVYHLYRSLACATPHPNALMNLEREFRELYKRKDKATKHALTAWFVKLHAFYFRGKEFSERKSLESEVEHQLVLAMKTGSGYGSASDLLRIVLINITAYMTAQNRINEKWTDAGSLSCQYILSFNLRTITTIARYLGEVIADMIKRRGKETALEGSETSGTPGSFSQAEPQTSFSPSFNRILPLLRVYMTWFCFYESQLVEFRPHLEPQFGVMCTTLGDMLSLLFDLLGGEHSGKAVSWRFPEDEMTEGVRCLNGTDLKAQFRLSYDSSTGELKPRAEEVLEAANCSEDDLAFTRGLDVLFCAIHLGSTNSKFPLLSLDLKKGSREVTTFTFLEGGKPMPPPADRFVRPPSSTHTPTQKVANQPAVAPNFGVPNEASDNRDSHDSAPPKAAAKVVQQKQAANAEPPAPAAPIRRSEFPIDRQMFNILNEFINPPESTASVSQPVTPTGRPVPSPYGPNFASGAAPTASGGPNSPARGATGAGTFPTLPWEYFYRPPVNSTLQNPLVSSTGTNWGATNGSGLSRPASSGNLGGTQGAGDSIGDRYARRGDQKDESVAGSSTMEDQVGVLRFLDLGSGDVGSGDRETWPNTAPPTQTAHVSVPLPAPSPQYNTWGASRGPWQTAYGNNLGTADRNGISNSPFSTLNFSAGSSGLPRVNSPWGLPHPNNFNDQASARHSPSAWHDARQPRTGPAQPRQVDIWGQPIQNPQQSAFDGNANGNPSTPQGMHKR
ncbi:uncharacterized protein C8A04DRAFT_12200 [Dichotomopilus funicola]|uniref:Nonsense-mediated mRNA decay factor n=1 Tax=Dichotomopilus funicola TaxID=1934379 RepID=A0AAN6ZMA1_9PEZI|nr:hypothetical protein C8A04DRAFT_12200 [Dichotomopilus funicola]